MRKKTAKPKTKVSSEPAPKPVTKLVSRLNKPFWTNRDSTYQTGLDFPHQPTFDYSSAFQALCAYKNQSRWRILMDHWDGNLTPTVSSNDRLKEQQVGFHHRRHGLRAVLAICLAECHCHTDHTNSDESCSAMSLVLLLHKHDDDWIPFLVTTPKEQTNRRKIKVAKFGQKCKCPIYLLHVLHHRVN